MTEPATREALVRTLAARAGQLTQSDIEQITAAFALLGRHIQEQVMPAFHSFGRLFMQEIQRTVHVIAGAWPSVRTAYISRALPRYAERAQLLRIPALLPPREGQE